ncbi:MAG: 5-formyltetrahydrofolate cyclo-ligase [Myxococcaceae bacterium]|nr:5-formyltetrahydrofolate cyclo-ligase [Myxococcaceae bacterium]
MTVGEAKRALRATMKARRAELAEASSDAASAVLRHVTLRARPRVVSGTMPVGNELDPRPLMRHLASLGTLLSLPRTPPRGQPLTFHAWTPQTRFVRSGFGIEEPAPETALLVPDLVLVPLLAFDRTGARLGYGGGYYDLTLRTLRAQGAVFALGLAYSGQEVPLVPTEPFDERLDAVVTEAGWIDATAR